MRKFILPFILVLLITSVSWAQVRGKIVTEPILPKDSQI